jgi:carbon monoxide dehydrogenase subunit G
MGERYGQRRVRNRFVSVLTVQADVAAPPNHVWAVVADPRNLTRWDRRITAVTGVPEGGLEPGTEYTTEIRFMGIKARVRAEVLEIEPPRFAKVRLHGLLEATVESWLEPLDGDHTRLRHRVDYRFKGGPFGQLGARILRGLGGASLLRRGVEAQKRQAEEAARRER